MRNFQSYVALWLVDCFGQQVAHDKQERNHRFLEEALELVQSIGCTKNEALQLVDYTFSRPLGEPAQEVGGVMVTLAALCTASGIDMDHAGGLEYHRVLAMITQIREKQKNKPKFSPLPGGADNPPPPDTEKNPSPVIDQANLSAGLAHLLKEFTKAVRDRNTTASGRKGIIAQYGDDISALIIQSIIK